MQCLERGWIMVAAGNRFKKKTVTGINGRQLTTKTLMEWASVKVGSTRCCQGGMKKQTRVKQTKEVLITTPPMHRFIQYFIKGHTFDYEKRFCINAQLIPWLCQTYLFHCSKMFSPITLLMDLRWTLIWTAHFLAKHLLLLSVIDGSTAINSPAEELHTDGIHLHSAGI